MWHICSAFQATVIILLVSSGALITLDLKWSDEIPCRNSIGRKESFSHPLFQVTIVFLGSLLCLGIFYVQTFLQQSESKDSIHGNNVICKLIFKQSLFWKAVARQGFLKKGF